MAAEWECPICHREMMSEHEACSGSFTEKDHPSAVRAIPRMHEREEPDAAARSCPCGAPCEKGQTYCPICLEHAEDDGEPA